MEKTLLILEVSQKQRYIFSSKKLRENAARSGEISYVTGTAFFKEKAGDLYNEADNLIYAGGGHTVLQFDSREQATLFARRVTEAAVKEYRGMELFAKQIPYRKELLPGENLLALSKALEEKKMTRKTAFRQITLGVEVSNTEPTGLKNEDLLEAPIGFLYPKDFQQLAGDDNFIAVIHIDGNAMGTRVQDIYKRQKTWHSCCGSLKRFSEGIQHDFECAFLKTVETVIEKQQLKEGVLPIRPVILAGDDVCFVTAGKIGLECARIYLEKLTQMENKEQPGKPYAACAGVVIVHTKYPFHQAYDFAEALCSNAKKFGAAIDSNGGISAMDWHIEFGQLKGSLSAQREDYITDDENRMELRPITVVEPKPLKAAAEAITGKVRTYSFFREMCRAMQGEYGKIARGKIKELRVAIKQGEVETSYFMQDKQIRDLLYHPFAAKYHGRDQRLFLQEIIRNGGMENKGAFLQIKDEKRCLFFDAIEMIDHCTFFEEASR